MEKTSGIKLYNVLFPVWMLLLFPQVWLIVLPGNFIIDSLVFLISMRVLKITLKKQWYKKHILQIFAFGMLSDLIGAASLLGVMMAFEIGVRGDELYLTVPAMLLSAGMIFVLNYFVLLVYHIFFGNARGFSEFVLKISKNRFFKTFFAIRIFRILILE